MTDHVCFLTNNCCMRCKNFKALLECVRVTGNNDTDAVFPTGLRVNRSKVPNALKWLLKHNPFHRSMAVKEENLNWMSGADEVNMGANGIVLNMKESSRSKMKETEEEHVSSAHSTKHDDNDNALSMHAVCANESTKVPS